jgi:hypothetical protein
VDLSEKFQTLSLVLMSKGVPDICRRRLPPDLWTVYAIQKLICISFNSWKCSVTVFNFPRNFRLMCYLIFILVMERPGRTTQHGHTQLKLSKPTDREMIPVLFYLRSFSVDCLSCHALYFGLSDNWFWPSVSRTKDIKGKLHDYLHDC